MAALVLLLCCSWAQTPKPITVVVLPVQVRNGVAPGAAQLITDALVDEASRQPGYQVVAFSEIEQTMNAEQVRQLLSCDTTNCAAEVAGAMNADETVSGSLGVLGGSLVLNLSRVRSRDATVVGRVLERAAGTQPEVLLDRVPAVTRRLWGAPEPVAVITAPAETSHPFPLRRAVLWGAAVPSVMVVLVCAVAGAALAVTSGALQIKDAAGSGQLLPVHHAVSPTEALIHDVTLLMLPAPVVLGAVFIAVTVAFGVGGFI